MVMDRTKPATSLIEVGRIIVGKNRRAIRDVESLAGSITELGLLNPITVTDGLRLVAGGRRLAAVKSLKWESVPCNVVKLSDLHAELAEIDENLIRDELTVLEQSEQLKRRKEIYEALHPETKAGVAGGKARHGSASEMISFASDTAAKTGKTPRTVQQEVQIASDLHDDAKEAIRETPLADNKTELLKLARVEKSKQAAVAGKIKSGEVKDVVQGVRALAREEKREELQSKAAAAPKSKDQSWTIITGDSLAELPKLAAGTFRLIFADPPYNIGVDYGGGGAADLLPDEQFVGWCGKWIRECARLLADDGSLWLLIGDEYADYIGLELRKAGLHRRAWVKWYESFGVNVANNFNRTSRHLFYCVKDARNFVFDSAAVNRPSDRQLKYGDKRADPGGKIWDDVWGINPPIPRLTGTAAERIPDFPTQLPLALLRPIVLCASEPGDSILDPFNGSGTTGVAAVTEGRRYVGIEKSEKFAGLAEMRLKGTAAERKAS